MCLCVCIYTLISTLVDIHVSVCLNFIIGTDYRYIEIYYIMSEIFFIHVRGTLVYNIVYEFKEEEFCSKTRDTCLSTEYFIQFVLS